MVTRRIRDLEYAIRDVAKLANEIKKTGKTIYHLNIGDPVIYDFKTPEYISKALANATYAGQNYYVNSLGVSELREEVARFEGERHDISITEDDVLITEDGNEVLTAGVPKEIDEIEKMMENDRVIR